MIESTHTGAGDLLQVRPSERRSPLTMGLVWITMVTAFPAVLIGFEWFKQGFSLSQVLFCTVLSCLILLAYAIPATQLGARSGLGYCALSRAVFGRFGTWLVTANLIWIFVAWYGITAVWMAEAIKDFFHVQFSVVWMSVIFAFLMAFNNFFGFSGVANFARFFAAPALIGWVGYTFARAVSSSSPSVIAEPAHQSMLHALTAISTFVIGFAAWGNEMDYWRYAKTGSMRAAIPLAVAVLIGEIIFPVSGWLVARMTGLTDHTAAIAFMNNYSFAGLAVVGVIILAASYFAANDSNLFGSAMALESLWPFKHRTSVTILAAVGALTAAILSTLGATQSLEVIASLNCVIAPTPTVILLTDWFLIEKVFRSSPDFSYVPSFEKMPLVRWPALLALIAGLCAGIATSGLFPALGWLHVGICPVQAWLTAASVYGVLRLAEHRLELAALRRLRQSVRLERNNARGASIDQTQVDS